MKFEIGRPTDELSQSQHTSLGFFNAFKRWLETVFQEPVDHLITFVQSEFERIEPAKISRDFISFQKCKVSILHNSGSISYKLPNIKSWNFYSQFDLIQCAVRFYYLQRSLKHQKSQGEMILCEFIFLALNKWIFLNSKFRSCTCTKIIKRLKISTFRIVSFLFLLQYAMSKSLIHFENVFQRYV